MSFLGVPHLHFTILPLVPCPFWLYPSNWSQVPFQGYPSSRQGVPQAKRYPRWGTPQPGQDGVPLPAAKSGWGIPPARTGIPPSQVRIGYPPKSRLGYPLGRLRLGRLRRGGGGGPPLAASHGRTLLFCESFHCAWILFEEVWLSSFPGSRKGRCNYQRKHEYIMRSRSLVQKIKQLGEPTNTKASQPKEMANSITKEVSTSAIDSSQDGTTTLVDFIQEPLQNMSPKCDSGEFIQDQPLNLSKKTQNQIIAPKAGALCSHKYILVLIKTRIRQKSYLFI